MKKSQLHWIGLGAWFGIVATAVVACGGGGGSAPTSQTGTARFAITDAPACGFDHVWVQVEKVSVNMNANAQDGDAGWTDLALASPQRIDLLSLSNGVLQELGSVPLAAGHYSQVRLVLSANGGSATPPNAVQPTGGAVAALTTPSGQQSGIKLPANFDVAAGQMADLVLDFNACASVVKAGNSGQYLLKPVISVVPRTVTAIQGAVTTTLTLSSTTVSAQQDGATVRSTTPDASGNFSIPFLSPGTYTLVITSDAHATGVVTSVPAGTTTTVVSPTPIVLPSSGMADVSGSVMAGTTPVTDATIRATQTLSGGPTIEVARQGVDATAGTFHVRLPQGAPVKAPYTGAALTFTPDSSVAGKYTVESSASGRATLTQTANVTTATTATLTFGY